jgi:hypothetical protein
MTARRIPFRAVLLLPGGFALAAGLDGALMLLGLHAPVQATRLTGVHGILLTLGFVGTVIALERAVATQRRWAYLAPAFLAGGALLLTLRTPQNLGGTLLFAGSAMLVAVYVPLWRRSADVAILIQAAGAVLATGAVLLWLGGLPVPDLLPWLSGFLILTIVGERLELARVAILGTHAEGLLAAVATAMLLGTVAALLWPTSGYPLLGATLLATVLWLGRFDIVRHTWRATGLTRYVAVSLGVGYLWLLVPALTWLLVGQDASGRGYDAVVHAVMLGFVLSMIMAHAPVILPAVIRRPLPYIWQMYIPVALLHLSLLLRLAVGDARNVLWALQVGGVLNVIAVLGFLAVALYSATHATTQVPA